MSVFIKLQMFKEIIIPVKLSRRVSSVKLCSDKQPSHFLLHSPYMAKTALSTVLVIVREAYALYKTQKYEQEKPEQIRMYHLRIRIS